VSRNTNKPAVQGAAQALDKMKYEIASELGITNYNQIDKGQLTSRQNGYVGGYMTRKLVQFAEEAMSRGQG
jgi:small acid-soluble spore protein A (major alpha-type SASP)